MAALQRGVVAPSQLAGRLVTFIEAIEMFQSDETFTTPISRADKAWLKIIFRDRERVTDTELREEIAARTHAPALVELQQRRA
jgi:hypothetical protein